MDRRSMQLTNNSRKEIRDYVEKHAGYRAEAALARRSTGSDLRDPRDLSECWRQLMKQSFGKELNLRVI